VCKVFQASIKDSFPLIYNSEIYINNCEPGNCWDINNDEIEEIVTSWGYTNTEIGVVDNNASFLPGFPVFLEGQRGRSESAVADLDRDGYFEIILSPIRKVPDFHRVYFHVIEEDGNFFPGWPVIYENDSIYFYPLNNYGELEIIFPVRF